MVLSMEKWVGKVAVVTGSSSGIGAAVTHKLIQEGIKVIGLDQNEANTPKTDQMYFLNTDVSKEEDVQKAFHWIIENFGPVSILINCAGIVRKETVIDGKTQNLKEILNVNVFGLCVTTKEAIKIMREKNIYGHIIHINSIYGHKVSRAGSSIYPASKHAVTAITEILRLELNSVNSKIKVTSISPGYVDTPIHAENVRKSENFQQLIAERMLKPDDIADAIVFVLSTPSHVQVQELTIKHVNSYF